MVSREVKPAPREKASGRPWPSRLTNIAKQAGLTEPTVYGAESNVQYLAETSSGGVALFDYDGDGWQDIYLACDSRPSLFLHNNHNGIYPEQRIERGLALTAEGRE